MSYCFLDGGVGSYGYSNANKYTTLANNGPTFFEWGLPSGTFSAKTFLTVQGGVYFDFNTPSPYQLSVNNGGAGAFVNVAGHNDAGVQLTSPFVITSFSEPITGSKVQVVFDSLFHTGGNVFAVMQEGVAIQDQLERVEISSAVASSTLGGYPATQAFDNQGHLGWAAATSLPGETITLTLATPSDIGALFISGVDSRDELFDIYFDGSLAPAVTDVEWAGTDNSVFIKLDSVATDVSSIALVLKNSPNGGANVHWIGEVIPFEIIEPIVVPEPSSAWLLAFGGAALVARRRGIRPRK